MLNSSSNSLNSPNSLNSIHSSVTYEQFRDFLHMKAFDVIGDNSYRRYVVQCKDNGDDWAQRMCVGVQQMNNCIKKVSTLVDSLQTDGKIKLYKVCLEVMSSLNHPLKERAGWNVCFISGERSDSCVEVSRSGRSDTCTVVHSKFSTFISLLWYVVKFEQIVRMMTKQWVEAKTMGLPDPLCREVREAKAGVNKAGGGTRASQNPHELCTEFAKHDAIFEVSTILFICYMLLSILANPHDLVPQDMFSTFKTAYEYVHLSLEHYNCDSTFIFRVSQLPQSIQKKQ